jgi:hypothetical protein
MTANHRLMTAIMVRVTNLTPRGSASPTHGGGGERQAVPGEVVARVPRGVAVQVDPLERERLGNPNFKSGFSL